jgi:hypothetical protein
MDGLLELSLIKRADWYDGYKAFTHELTQSPLAKGVDIKSTDRGITRFGKQVFNFGASLNPFGHVARAADNFANDRWGKGFIDSGSALLSATGTGFGGKALFNKGLSKVAPNTASNLANATSRKFITRPAYAGGGTALAGGLTSQWLNPNGQMPIPPNTPKFQRSLGQDLLGTHA